MVGSFPSRLSPLKDRIDFWLTRIPKLYLAIEKRRRWINWDKRVYLFFVRAGDTVLDIGANVGRHTVFLSHLAGKRGRVIAFEPVERNLRELTQQLRARSRFDNVTTHALALGGPKAAGDVGMKIPGDDYTQAALTVHMAESWSVNGGITETRATFSSLDVQFPLLRVSRLDFVKIDVEGAELDVLKGAVESIKRFHPLIYCEVFEKWAQSFGYTPGDLFAYLAGLGYAGVRIFHGARISALDLGCPYTAAWFEASADALFFMPSHAERLRAFDRRFAVEAAFTEPGK